MESPGLSGRGRRKDNMLWWIGAFVAWLIGAA